MELIPVRHLWGVTEPLDVAIPRFAALGYRHIEAPLLPDAATKLLPLLEKHNLGFLPMGFTGGTNVAEHVSSFRGIVDSARRLPTPPMLLNVHSGRDAFTPAESLQFYRECLRIEADAGFPIAHETHRGRVFYNPWRTAEVLTELGPELKLTCDFSHWVVVAERLLDTEAKELALAARHCIHLHARVGHPEGPQVPDPSAPEYQSCLAAHETWWRQIWTEQRNGNRLQTTFTPEFGPPGYLQTLPHTNVPVADLQKVCEWMTTRVKQTYANWFQSA